MKAIERLPWFGLTGDLPDGETVILCDFCRYAEWRGSCGEATSICRHPLKDNFGDIDNEFDFAYSNPNCWGFRPLWSVADCADMVGLWLQGQLADMSSCTELGKGKAQ